MRKDLLVQANMLAETVDIKHLSSLTGTEADLDSPDYLRLKIQLSAVHAVIPKCRFVYLIGRRADGTVFFYADNEPAGSKDESPAGQLYTDVPEEYLRVFDTWAGSVEGPVTDRWGTWVTALAPVIEPNTGRLIAVLCMDFDARGWKWNLATQAALPVGLIFMLMAMSFLVVMLRDRTLKLRVNEQKYRYLFEGAAGGIAIIKEEKIEFANPSLERITGQPLEKLISGSFIAFIHPDDQSGVFNRHNRRMKGEEFEPGYDFRIIASDGSLKWVTINSQLIQWEGEPANLCFFTDITFRKQTEEKLATMYEETSRMNWLMRGREERIMELKKEVNSLSRQLNQAVIYKSVEE